MLAPALTNLVFYLTVAVSLWLAWSVVSSRRILRAAVSLMGVLGASAALYLILGFPFLAGVQVLVYVGGIVVLLVFAVMLTRSQELLEDHPSDRRHKIGVVVAGAFFAVHTWVVRVMPPLPPPRRGLPASDTELIGQALLGTGAEGYALPFEVISLLLLAAMVGGIVIARKTGAAAPAAVAAEPAAAAPSLPSSSEATHG